MILMVWQLIVIMISVVLVSWTGVNLYFNYKDKKELQAKWKARDEKLGIEDELTRLEREASEALYAVDPKLAIELGYTPPERPKPQQLHDTYMTYLAPGLSEMFLGRGDPRAQFQRTPEEYRIRQQQLQQDQRVRQPLTGLLGESGTCICAHMQNNCDPRQPLCKFKDHSAS